MAELTNEEKSRYFDAMFDALSDMVRVVTREGRITYSNKAYRRKLGKADPAAGRDAMDAIFDESECSDPKITRRVLESGERAQTTLMRGTRTYSVTVAPFMNEDGVVMGTVEVFRDITLDMNVRSNLVLKNSRLNGALSLAQSLQNAWKGQIPQIEGYTIYPFFKWYEGVSGDMYECIPVGGKLVLSVADAAGHGIMPAMMAMFFSMEMRAACLAGLTDPTEILRYVQKRFMTVNYSDGFYITAFVVVLDLASGDYDYSSAGLSVVPIQYAEGEITELRMDAPPISRWFSDPHFGLAHGHMNAGDRLLLFTDGLRDIHTDPKKLPKLHAMFCAKDFECDEFVRSVNRELHIHPEDDLTMLICVRQEKIQEESACQT